MDEAQVELVAECRLEQRSFRIVLAFDETTVTEGCRGWNIR